MAKTIHEFKLPITNETDLYDFIVYTTGVKIPNKKVCEHHTTPWNAFADAYFARTPVSVWHASRGFGGKSFLLSLLTWAEAVSLKADANVLGASGEQSMRVYSHLMRYWSSPGCPKVLVGDPNKTLTKLKWGNQIQALMASQASVRGPHPQRLRMDEIDEMQMEILDAAMGQPMMGDSGIKPQVVMSSTRQYSNGTMDKILERAALKGWGVYEWCYKENLEPHGWLTQDEVDMKRDSVTHEMWMAEYENQDPNPGARAIQVDAVERMFDTSLGEFRGEANEYIEIEPPEEDGVYATGTDWAKERDWTVIDTIRVDVNPAKRVAWLRVGRLDWNVMVVKHEERVRRYKGRAVHDATGVGNVVNDYLNVPSFPFIMAGRERAQLLSRYITAIEHGEIISPKIDFVYSEHKYASNEDLFATGSNHHLPDSIAAGALAWSAYKHAGVSKEPQKKRSNWLGSAFSDSRR